MRVCTFTHRNIAWDMLECFLSIFNSQETEYKCNTGEEGKREEYKKMGRDMLDAIETIFYNPQEGTWFDFDLKARRAEKRQNKLLSLAEQSTHSRVLSVNDISPVDGQLLGSGLGQGERHSKLHDG